MEVQSLSCLHVFSQRLWVLDSSKKRCGEGSEGCANQFYTPPSLAEMLCIVKFVLSTVLSGLCLLYCVNLAILAHWVQGRIRRGRIHSQLANRLTVYYTAAEIGILIIVCKHACVKEPQRVA